MPDVVEAGPSRKRHGNDTLYESLRGQLSISDMGTSVARAPSPETKDYHIASSRKLRSIDTEGLTKVLVLVHEFFPDAPSNVTASAADSILATLRDGSKSDAVKRNEVQEILGDRLSIEKFNELYNACQSIQDAGPNSFALLDLSLSDDNSESDEETSESDDDDDDDDDNDEQTRLNGEPHKATNAAKDWVPINRLVPLSLSGNHLSPNEITRSWLATALEPTGESVKEIMAILAIDDKNLMKESLQEVLGADHQGLLKTLSLNRDVVFWRTKLHRADSAAERDEITRQILSTGLDWILNENVDNDRMLADPNDLPTKLNLADLERSAATHKVTKVSLPPGSTKFSRPSYEQYNVPPTIASKAHSSERPVSDLPIWAQPLFAGIKKLNPVQSKVSEFILTTDQNALVCAPTGAGKTNIALLAIARCLHQRSSKNCKVVYLSPLKALVQEQVRTFSERLGPLGLEVCELSGDNSLSWQQLESANIIVSTPEKWDVVSRKAVNSSLVQAVNLVVIDEIHLLHDKRGPVLENIVARIELNERTASGTRLLGLSATMPNYMDIAAFLKATESGTFAFGPEYRPCPLSQVYVGVTDPNPVRRLKSIEEACFDKVVEARENGSQVIIFVQSRKATLKTAQTIIERATELGRLELLGRNDLASAFENEAIQDIAGHGLGIHHAGLDRDQRSKMESQFIEGKIQILVSTATLAWGVNLPAHTVIIKGTTFYDPQLSAWRQLAPQDVLQMLGRAGRPGFDTEGIGIIITDHSELNYYMSIATASLPIESELIGRLVDSLNAEISNGRVGSLQQGVDWLAHTYLYVRMLRAPQVYKVQVLPDETDPTLLRWRQSLVYSALVELEAAGCIYPLAGPGVVPTDLGRISADFYIVPDSISTYAQQLKPWLGPIDVFRIFARSREFQNIPVRKAEIAEIERLVNVVPVPIREEPKSRSAKIQVLLQAYICRLGLSGFALAADTSYIAQSASRLFRAMLEIAIIKRWANLAMTLLDIFKIVDHRMWLTSSPFRHFVHCSHEIIRMAESSQMPWNRYFDLESPAEVGEALRNERLGAEAYALLQQFPRVGLSVQVRPLSPTSYIVLVDIQPRFEWHKEVLGSSQLFYLSVEDSEGNILYAWEPFVLKQNYAHIPHFRSLPIIVEEDPGPFLFVRVNSERWLQSSATVSVDLRRLAQPPRIPPPTPMSHEKHLRDALGETSSSLYIGTPGMSFKFIEEAINSALRDRKRVLFIVRSEDMRKRYSTRFSELLQDPTESRDVGLSVLSVDAWEPLTRRWRANRKVLLADVLIFDQLHCVGGLGGERYEAAISRTKYWTTQLEHDIQVIGVGLPIAGVRSLGTWLNISKQNAFNFVDRTPQIELELEALPGISQRQRESFLLMLESAIKSIDQTQIAILIVVPESRLFSATTKALKLAGIDSVILHESITDLAQGTIVADRDFINLVPLHQTFDAILIVDTQFWDGAEYRYIDYPTALILEMCSRATRRAVIYTLPSKREYYAKFLSEPLPVESNLPTWIADVLASEVANGVIKNGEDAVDWITYSYFFQRLHSNPSYYGLKCPEYGSKVSDEDVNDYLSELVESSLEQLIESRIIELTDEDSLAVKSLNGAQVVARDGVAVGTVSALQDMTAYTKDSILNTLMLQTSEFDNLIELKQSDSRYNWLVESLPFGGGLNTTVTGEKALALLQLRMSRTVPQELKLDEQKVAVRMRRLLSAAIDVFAGEGNLGGTLLSLDLFQQVTQALWANDSPLMQLPHVNSEIAARCVDAGIETVLDFLTIEEDDFRAKLLGFDNSDPRMVDVALFANNYPSIDVKARLTGPLSVDDVNSVHVDIEREIEEGEVPTVITSVPLLDDNIEEEWHILIGDPSSNELFGRSKISIDTPEKSLKVDFWLPHIPTGPLTLWCICTSYIDADKEIAIDL